MGKTTCAAATALQCAEKGNRTLIISTDAAHSLGDSLGISLEAVPKKIQENLFAMEIDPAYEMKREFESVKRYIVEYMGTKDVDEILAEEMVMFPGVNELFCMLQIERIKRNNEFDVLILDMAPTGNTFRFLNFPEFLAIIRRGLVLDRYASKLLRPFKGFVSTLLPADNFYSTIFDLFDRIAQTKRGLIENAVIRLIVTPERMAIMETQRALTFLNLSMFSVDSLIVNRIIPEEVRDPYFVEWKNIQERYIQEIEQSFYPLKILKVRLFPQEVIGEKLLQKVGTTIYNGLDPVKKLANVKPFTVTKNSDEIVLSICLPFSGTDKISINKEGERILIKTGSFIKALYLPLAFIDFDIVSHVFKDRRLVVNLKDKSLSCSAT